MGPCDCGAARATAHLAGRAGCAWSRRRRALVNAFVTAWERADLPALLDLLAEGARFTMPPLPACFDGREDTGGFCRGGVRHAIAAGAGRGERAAGVRLLPVRG